MLAGLKTLFGGIDRSAWIRFFVAIFGLVLAFSAALLSSVSRESGNLLATAILASAALLLAGVVGFATVPFLARRVVAGRVRDAFDYDVTKEGVAYLGLTLLIGIAALNTGNNLHFLVVAAMLGAILVSGIASAIMLRGLRLDIVLPEHIFAERKVAARLILENPRRFIPAFSVSIVPPKVRKSHKKIEWSRASFAFPPERFGRRVWFRWPDLTVRVVKTVPSVPQILKEPAYFPYIPTEDSVHADVDLKFEKRGRYVQDTFGVASRFPFSFLVKTRRVKLMREIVVYPKVEQTDELLEVLPMITGEYDSFVRGRGYDLYRIREYTPEDSARHVDWKATAKSGSVKVREYSREDERKLRIVFDNPAKGALRPEVYESAVELAGSLAWHFVSEKAQVSFAGENYNGSPDVFNFLEYLALVQPGGAPAPLEPYCLVNDYNVVVTSRARGSIPNPLWQSAYFIFMK